MEIITSHGNADFDSFAAMLAAHKLHPGARIVFSGSKETALQAFIDNPYYRFDEVRLRDLDFDSVDKMILVDVSHSSRLGPLAELARKPDVKVVIYDHHSSPESDIKASRTLIRPYGAVTTLLLRLLRRRRIAISRMEATIMAMGIYEDTGFLTYRTTTPEDARQIAYLLSCGADLSLVSNFLSRDLSTEQLSLLNQLIAGARSHDVAGVPVIISTAEREDFVSDAASVVHKQVELERYLVYVAVMRMGDKVHVIGRSRHHRVDISRALGEIGGGGHATAASAVVSDKTTVEVVEQLISVLRSTVKPTLMARDIMHPNPHSIGAEEDIRDARSKIVKLNINSLPIERGGRVVGIVTRQQLDRAAAHRLRGKVSEVMNPDIVIVPPDASIDEAEELLMEGTQRALLVGDGPGKVEGIITRMDLFLRLYVERRDARDRTRIDLQRSSRSLNVADMLDKRLDQRVLEALKLASETAQQQGKEVYLVGGIVRDLLLNLPNKDVDLVVSADGIGFAHEMAARGGGYAKAHPHFGTAVVIFPDGFRLDVATARSESYPSPGALPQVQKGGLRADLYRRDFTINTLAVSLVAGEFGRLIDYFGGLRDIRNRKVRVLHSLSFVDDPTRILRAIRFANRLSFEIADGTRQLMQGAMRRGMTRRVSGKRIHTEMKLLFDDPRPLHAAELLDRHGVLSALHGKVKLDRFTANLIRKIDASLSWFELNYLKGSPSRVLIFYMALFEKLRAHERRRLCERLDLPAKTSRILLRYKSDVRLSLALQRRKRAPLPSEFTILFDSMPLETALFIHAFSNREPMRQAVANYLTSYRLVRPRLRGKDLIALGLQPGPQFSEIFQRLRQARLDGEIDNREGEIRLVEEEFRKRG